MAEPLVPSDPMRRLPSIAVAVPASVARLRARRRGQVTPQVESRLARPEFRMARREFRMGRPEYHVARPEYHVARLELRVARLGAKTAFLPS